VKANVVTGDVLAAMGRKEVARESYEKALTMAQTVAPEYQVGWVEGIRGKLAAN
jgi:predicted negative regulator of RcsB-dependent stress response